MGQRRSILFLVRFSQANTVILGLILTALGLGGVLPAITSNLTLSVTLFSALEIILAASLWILTPAPARHEAPTLHVHTLQKTNTGGRFATAADFAGTDRIYNSRFDPNLSMNDADFRTLMARGNLVRVIEETFASGSERQLRISGYYALWPLKIEDFEAIVSGRIREEDLTAADIPHLDDPLVSILYLSEVCVSKDTDAGGALLRDMLKYVAHLLVTYSNITKVAAWPYSEDGRQLVKELQLKPCRTQLWGRRIHQIGRADALGSPFFTQGKFKDRWRSN